jgi:hypothetical protein
MREGCTARYGQQLSKKTIPQTVKPESDDTIIFGLPGGIHVWLG